MPNPIELILDPLSLCFIGIFISLIIIETLLAKRDLPRVPFWKTKGIVAFLSYFYLSSYLPMLTDGWLSRYQIIELQEFHFVLQFAIGLLVFELVFYTWHRAMHESKFLWRTFHQMHHSAERLDTFGAFWLSPLDMLGFTLTGSIALVLVLGLDVQVAIAIMFVTFIFAIFQHMNIQTPTWLGYFVQRPESHSIHHKQGFHRNNYADLPILDIVFGTFANPEQPVATGYYYGASSRIVDMLLFRDVSKPRNTTDAMPTAISH